MVTREIEPFAFELFRKLMGGQTTAQIAMENGIPLDRVEMRIRAVRQIIMYKTLTKGAVN